MVTQESISGRPELPIADAIKQSGFSFDDLIFKATKGEISIYILAENWKVFQVNSINYQKYIAESDLTSTQLEDKHSRAEKRLEFHVNYKNKFENTFNEGTDQNSIQTPVSDGYFTLYPKNGVYGLIYALPLIGFKPISKFMLNAYRGGNKKIAVALNLTENPIPVDEGTEVIVLPSPKILLDDAFNNDQLFVMNADIQRISPKKSSISDDAKPPDGIAEKKVKGRKPDTDARYQRWRELADEIVKKSKNVKTDHAVAIKIHAIVANGPREFYGSIRTIREHIAVKKTER